MAHETLKIDHSQLIVTDKAVFGTIYSNCLTNTKTIIHLSVGESGGYLPCRFTARQISTT